MLLVAAGCNDGTDFLGLADHSREKKESDGTQPREITPHPICAGQSPPVERLPDPATLPACSPACGGAHCVPVDKVPAASRPFFAQCGGGYCLPDSLIASGGAR